MRITRTCILLAACAAIIACGDDEEDTSSGTTTSQGGTSTTATGGTGGMATGGTGGSGGATSGAGGTSCDDLACSDCNDCAIADACMAENDACDAVCNDYASCVAGCDSSMPTCYTDCEMMHADGVDAFNALIGCICGTCSSSCSANPLCAAGG